MKTLIAGNGEVGSALGKVLKAYDPQFVEKDSLINLEFGDNETFDILHICFPYSEEFEENVKAYQERFKPKYTVIHSTVPVGTSRLLGAIHSPIRGVHPNLTEGIKTFVKFLGGAEANQVSDYFRRAGLRVVLFDDSEATEALKLFDTEYYRACIEFAHRVKRFCDKNNLNFHEVYTLGNQTYNDGYTQLGHPEFVRPILQPIMTEIGGHCILPNKDILSRQE